MKHAKDPVYQEILDITATNIKERRSNADWSQDDFAILASLTRSYYSAVEVGKFNLSLIKICIIARYLNVEPGELLPTLAQLKEIIIDDEPKTIQGMVSKNQKARRDRKTPKNKAD